MNDGLNTYPLQEGQKCIVLDVFYGVFRLLVELQQLGTQARQDDFVRVQRLVFHRELNVAELGIIYNSEHVSRQNGRPHAS